jgi:anti-sigma B factor antagonist
MHWTEIVERQSGDVLIFDLHGQMTLSGEEPPRLLLEIRRAVTAGWRTVLLNLTQVSYVDSTGIGEIVGAYTRVPRAFVSNPFPPSAPSRSLRRLC